MGPAWPARRRPLALRWRLALGYGLAALLVLTLLGAGEVWSARQILSAQALDDLRTSSQAAIHAVERAAPPAHARGRKALDAGSAVVLHDARTLADDLSSGASVAIVSDSGGHPLAHGYHQGTATSGADGAAWRAILSSPAVQAAIARRAAMHAALSVPSGAYLVLVTPLRLAASPARRTGAGSAGRRPGRGTEYRLHRRRARAIGARHARRHGARHRRRHGARGAGGTARAPPAAHDGAHRGPHRGRRHRAARLAGADQG